MKEIEQIIREKDREPFFRYYRSLDYDRRTAAVLALFTYGEHSFRSLSMDALYEALRREEEYLPPEVLAERRRWETEHAAAGPVSGAMGSHAPGYGGSPTPLRAAASSAKSFFGGISSLFRPCPLNTRPAKRERFRFGSGRHSKQSSVPITVQSKRS